MNAFRNALAGVAVVLFDGGEDGSVALVSSSGSIAAMLYQGRGRAIRSAASIGNEAVTTAAAFIADAIAQPAIGGVIAFLETIREPAGMAEALRLADAAGKPVALRLTRIPSPHGLRADGGHP